MDKSHAIGCLLQISNSSTLQGGFNLFADATLFGITFWAESFLCRVTKKIIQTVKWVMTSFHLPIKKHNFERRVIKFLQEWLAPYLPKFYIVRFIVVIEGRAFVLLIFEKTKSC